MKRSSALLASLLVVACGAASTEGGGAQSGRLAKKHELIDDVAPSFSGESVNGKGTVAIDGLRGKVVLVDFFATWCEPCKRSFPKYEDLRVKYETSGLVIVALSEDEEDVGAIKRFGETFGAKFPLLWDKEKVIASKWQLSNMPSSFIVDKKGVVRFVHLGYHDGEEREIEQEVKSLLF
jgi:cytochrome c biogenesis protein CcmG, thiol:disulfide interchange protein DsbE